jgi:hypothetical protein
MDKGGMPGYSRIQALDVLSRLLDVEMCPFFRWKGRRHAQYSMGIGDRLGQWQAVFNKQRH